MEYAIKNNGIYESVPFNIASKTDAIQTKGKTQITLQTKIEDNNFVDYQTIPSKESVTKLDFPLSITLRLISKQNFDYTIPNTPPKYYNKRKIEDYLYDITYGNIDYDYAYEYFKPSVSGGCSTVRNGNFVGRNFDWLYNNQVQFIVHTPTSFDHYATIGVSGIIPNVEQDNVEDEEIIVDGVDMFKLVPFYLLDGLNEKGVFCTHNLVPLDDKDYPTTIVTAKIEERERISIPMLTRFVVDKFKNAKEAVDYIRDYVTLFFPDEMIDDGYQSHFMIGDGYSTYIIEFINNELQILKEKYITNFNISNVEFDKDRKVQYPPTEYGIDEYGFGLERWNIISENYKKSNTLDGMEELMESLMMSNGYGEPFWYSELVRKTDDSGSTITVDTEPSLCETAKTEAIDDFENKDRDNPKVTITCHSSIYDVIKKKLYIRNQENIIEYEVDL